MTSHVISQTRCVIQNNSLHIEPKTGGNYANKKINSHINFQHHLKTLTNDWIERWNSRNKIRPFKEIYVRNYSFQLLSTKQKHPEAGHSCSSLFAADRPEIASSSFCVFSLNLVKKLLTFRTSSSMAGLNVIRIVNRGTRAEIFAVSTFCSWWSSVRPFRNCWKEA